MGKEVKFTKRPTPKELVGVIGELQHLIGKAKGDYLEEGPWRADKVVENLEEAFALAVRTRAWFPHTW